MISTARGEHCEVLEGRRGASTIADGFEAVHRQAVHVTGRVKIAAMPGDVAERHAHVRDRCRVIELSPDGDGAVAQVLRLVE